MNKLLNFKYLLSVFILVLLLISNWSYSQKRDSKADSKLKSGYVSDGQIHTFHITNSKVTQLSIIFYPKLRYRLHVICNNPKAIIEWSIINYQNEIIFTNTNKANIRTWDFEFESILNGKIYFKLKNTKLTKEDIQFIVGYQPIEHNFKPQL